MLGYELACTVRESNVIPGFGVIGAKYSVYVSRERENLFPTRDPTDSVQLIQVAEMRNGCAQSK
jgi:hypothetical protein